MEKKRRNLNFKNVDNIPVMLTRLSNYLINGEIDTKTYNSLIGGMRVLLQYYEISCIEADQQEIEDMTQELKDRGLL